MRKDTVTTKLVQKLHGQVEYYLGRETPNFSEFYEHYGRIMINGFEICGERQKTKGWGVYLAASIMDHSCVPNATVGFNGKTCWVDMSLVDQHLCFR